MLTCVQLHKLLYLYLPSIYPSTYLCIYLSIYLSRQLTGDINVVFARLTVAVNVDGSEQN